MENQKLHVVEYKDGEFIFEGGQKKSIYELARRKELNQIALENVDLSAMSVEEAMEIAEALGIWIREDSVIAAEFGKEIFLYLEHGYILKLFVSKIDKKLKALVFHAARV